MTLVALALVVASAFAHAGWNYLAKASGDKLVFSGSFTALAAVLYLPVALYYAVRAPISSEAWLYIAGTMVLHVVYFWLLSAAYARADLSIVYPVARGTGVLLIPPLAVIALGERISLPAAGAIALIFVGLIGVHTRGQGTALRGLAISFGEPGARLALLTGIVIATYSIWDKQGVQLVAPPLYNYFVFLSVGLLICPTLLRRRDKLWAELERGVWRIVAAAVLSPIAYLLVLTALSISPVSYVGPAREIGIVVGALLGAVALREPDWRQRILGSSIIVVGVALLAAT
ncbi:MAG: EamA family transporter [Chloroflexi bacterium]|nr:EamA family transporter [Chloroflexota bacterium]